MRFTVVVGSVGYGEKVRKLLHYVWIDKLLVSNILLLHQHKLYR